MLNSTLQTSTVLKRFCGTKILLKKIFKLPEQALEVRHVARSGRKHIGGRTA